MPLKQKSYPLGASLPVRFWTTYAMRLASFATEGCGRWPSPKALPSEMFPDTSEEATSAQRALQAYNEDERWPPEL